MDISAREATVRCARGVGLTVDTVADLRFHDGRLWLPGKLLWFSPLVEDRDAAEVEAAFRLPVEWLEDRVVVGGYQELFSDFGGNKLAAKRAAVVMAAAIAGMDGG